MLQVGFSPIKIIESEVQTSNNCISLSQGALKIGGVPQEIKDHLRKVLLTDKTDYYQSAWGIPQLREKIATKLFEKHGIFLTSKNILVTHGCMGALSTLLLTLLENGNEVILPEPTYPAYKNIVDVARGRSVFVSSQSIDTLESVRTRKTKIVLFSNPCNPTGIITKKSELLELVDWCEKHKIYLIVDESYDDYIFTDNFYSVTPLVKKNQFVIRTGSYSKSLSMSGWRLGFMVVPDYLSEKLGIVQDALLNCPNVIAQHAVLYALDHPESSEKFHNIIKRNRDEASDMLQILVDKKIISFQKPDAGFYLFLRYNQEINGFDLCFDLLKKARVGLVPGEAFGPSGRSFIRLCYAREPEVLNEGATRVVDYFLREKKYV
jgi:aspartate/methionine/tyrosine aminotransferase